MALITQNFRLNSLANQYAAALYNHISATSGDHFTINAGGQNVKVKIIGAAKGIRDLIDGYALTPIKDKYLMWEGVGIQLMTKCVNENGLTQTGMDIWQSMIRDMGATVAGKD